MMDSIIDSLINSPNMNTSAGGKITIAGRDNTFVSFSDKHSNSFKKESFEKVYEQNVNSRKDFSSGKTLEDIRESKHRIGEEKLNEINSFKEFLAEAVEESNAESSLDLTLARDINEIISELKEAAGITAEENSGEEFLASDSTTDEAEETQNTEDNADSAALILQSVNLDNTKIDNSSCSKDSADKNETCISRLIADEINTESESVDINLADIETDDSVINSSKTQENELESILDEEMLSELKVEALESDTGVSSENEGSLMDNQSPQEQAVKAMLHSDGDSFEINTIIQNQNSQTGQTVQAKTAEISPGKIIEQITKQMESLFNNSKVSIVLNPESLGRVNIQLVNSPDGLSAQFTVASNEVRDLLMKGLDGLKDTLASHGVGIDNISIKVNNTQKEADNPEWTDQEGSRGGNKGQNQPDREEKEKGLFEKTIAKTINDNNQNIEI